MAMVNRQKLLWAAGLFTASVFLIRYLLSVSMSLSFAPNDAADTDTPADGTVITRYQRDYSTLLIYCSHLLFIYMTVCLYKWWQHKYWFKHGGRARDRWYYRWRRWVGYEWCYLGTTWSFDRLLQIGGLWLVNYYQLLRDLVIDYPHRTLADMERQELANRAAQLALVNFTVCVLLSVRRSLLWRNAAYDQTIRWHMWFGRFGSLFAIYHACYQISRNYARHDGQLLQTFTSNVRYMTGTTMFLCAFVLVFGSHSLVRSLSYNLFRLLHLGAFLGLLAVGIWHHWAFLMLYAVALGCWLVDVVQRYFLDSAPTRIVSMEAMSGKIVKCKIELPYSMSRFVPGEMVYLSINRSRFGHWMYSHPFSICYMETYEMEEVPENETAAGDLLIKQGKRTVLTFCIRATGKRTQALYRLAQAQQDMDRVTLRVSQPVGWPRLTSAGHSYGDYDMVVLVAEGIGITPWISVMQYLCECSRTLHTSKVSLIWSIRTPATLHAFDEMLQQLQSLAANHLMISFDIFLTRTLSAEVEEENINLSPACRLHYGYPEYYALFKELQMQDSDYSQVALGVCAHNETISLCGNLARSAEFSNSQTLWTVHSERFQL
ncbi:uncharacterized protein BYT42DRAFT_597124 [Radiomyces spectabilis]|uniref:uncharacterized protein n=1 Tax=Radiomyces spectabilis TaxID=64574 RepID=UPI0022206CEE|nr:uncharacterized protein BYT42DRAFT_597124 [Radiomyces spectabilis]KAI8391725.1 hypothetical protein BYT42DRAFT_597124 [Radiomyces spectabilis]